MSSDLIIYEAYFDCQYENAQKNFFSIKGKRGRIVPGKLFVMDGK